MDHAIKDMKHDSEDTERRLMADGESFRGQTNAQLSTAISTNAKNILNLVTTGF